ncbi:hypothetical protein SAMN05421877_10418 [Sphingobacterium lactis]|uniref:Uncharacterized protein n=1 Tax=Sphingobacterium lactis TaxID=797291 RepID=A0A1H5WDA3_9SPHI|nr:hypothetical protein SAMN05421877_10418 [Sphingobacterium lactis]
MLSSLFLLLYFLLLEEVQCAIHLPDATGYPQVDNELPVQFKRLLPLITENNFLYLFQQPLNLLFLVILPFFQEILLFISESLSLTRSHQLTFSIRVRFLLPFQKNMV